MTIKTKQGKLNLSHPAHLAFRESPCCFELPGMERSPSTLGNVPSVGDHQMTRQAGFVDLLARRRPWPDWSTTLHELSITENLVSLAIDAFRGEASRDGLDGPCVEEVHLRVGLLAGVEKESLLFCYDIVIEGTPLAGSRLVIEDVPVVIFCPSCQAEQELPGIQSFLCPRCSQASCYVRQGRELELVSIKLSDRSTPLAD